MSRFIEKLNQVSQADFHPMGFGANQLSSQKLKMLLVASLAQDEANKLSDYVVGADAGLLRISALDSGAKILQELTQTVPDIPWGGCLRDSQSEIKEIVSAGCDFMVFPETNTPLALIQDAEIGKILEVESSLSADLLEAIDELPLDAILIGAKEEERQGLTWHHLILARRFADLSSKPLLVSIPSNVTASELQALRDAGVNGVIIQVDVGQPVGRLRELRQTIDKLTFPSRRKRRKAAALLPNIGNETNTEVTEEE